MARKRVARVRAAARKLAEQQRARDASEAQVIAAGVFAVARDLSGRLTDGSLYWQAPFQYVMECMAPRLVADRGLDPEVTEAVAEYLMAGVCEYTVAFVAGFDAEHFQAWRATMDRAASAGDVPAEGAGEGRIATRGGLDADSPRSAAAQPGSEDGGA